MNTIHLSNLIPAIYCRKSTESEERQVLSLPAQRDEAEKLIIQLGIKKWGQYEESKSAKVSGRRNAYIRMIKDLKLKKVNAIVCWKLDRLARNMVEGGEIIDLLQRGVIRAIITPSKVYYPNENALLMAVEFGAANQYSRDLSQNVKRGQERKAKGGYPTGRACIGFINDQSAVKGQRTWTVDKIRIPIIRQMFTMFLSGNYSGGKIHEWASNTAKLTTPKHKKSGNRLISRAGVYRLLRDPIYAGFFQLQGVRYELAEELPRIISEEEHYRILKMLGENDSPKMKSHEVIYSGFLYSCNNEYIGPDIKMQLVCDCKYKFSYLNKTHCPKCNAVILYLNSPKYLRYVYYRNVSRAKRKESVKCISEEQITDNLLSYVSGNLVLSENLIGWCIKYLTEITDEDDENNKVIRENKIKRLNELEEKKLRYREMLADGLFTKEEYLADINKIQREIIGIDFAVGKGRDWLNHAKEILTIGSEMINTFNKGSISAKRSVLSRFGSNLYWDEKNLIIICHKATQLVIDGLNEAQRENSRFEPKNTLADKDQTGVFKSVSPILRRMLDNVRNEIIES